MCSFRELEFLYRLQLYNTPPHLSYNKHRYSRLILRLPKLEFHSLDSLYLGLRSPSTTQTRASTPPLLSAPGATRESINQSSYPMEGSVLKLGIHSQTLLTYLCSSRDTLDILAFP